MVRGRGGAAQLGMTRLAWINVTLIVALIALAAEGLREIADDSAVDVSLSAR